MNVYHNKIHSVFQLWCCTEKR